jgi:hypothetical protein
VMNASDMSYLARVDTPDYYSTPYSQMQGQAPVEDEVIVVSGKIRHIFFGYDDADSLLNLRGWHPQQTVLTSYKDC